MSRKAINILFTVGSCLYVPAIVMIIWAYVILFQSMAQSPYPGADTFSSGLGTFMILIWVGAIMGSAGGIVLLVARIGALIELGKAQEWVWFTLMIIFGWIVLFIYLIAGPKAEPKPRYVGQPYSGPGGQPWGYMPQGPGMMPPAQPWPGYAPQGPMMPPAQPWPEYAQQGPMMSPAQPWPGYAQQGPGMPPMQPLSYPSPPERQNMPEKPQE